ncbi:CarD family transcriptional regulator [Oribacterium sp. P6A1]|uniref:CarD family transcriptional regulator n=1 Tax=Oribacterium sp. P6A1 TaxID=1410612 RepID=UPI0005634B3C|nr:CarD family transcriptional regulator [Oribacterium sp. P6A1]
MFHNGDYVVYGCKGIHKIIDTTILNLDGVSKDKEYYVMQPYDKPSGSVYAPVDSTKINMRKVMSKDEAKAFIKTVPGIGVLDIKNNKQREDAYKECIKSCSPDELMRVIKTLHLRKEERSSQGKKLTLTDTHYMQQAEGILYDELSLVLDMPKDDVPDYISDVVHKSVV